jgi:hypothetical protein
LFLPEIGPWFTKNTLERKREMQFSPWAWRARDSSELGDSGGALGRGRGGEGRGAYQLSICGRGWVEERRQLAGRRCTVSTAAAGSALVSFRPGMNRARHREVVGGLGRLRNALACGDIGRKGRLLGGAHSSAAGMSCDVCEEHGERSSIGKAQRRDASFNAAVRLPSCLACARD